METLTLERPETYPLPNNSIMPDAIAPGTAATSSDEKNALDKSITVKWLLKFALPTIASSVAMTAFGMVDSIFAARVISPQALAVVNLVFPMVTFVMAVGFMLATGGMALVSKQLGEGKAAEARANFTMLALVTLAVSVVLSAVGILFPNLVLNILGVDASLHALATEYMQPLLVVFPAAIVGFYLNQFFIAAGKPTLAMVASLVGGGVNISLNFLLIAHLQMGLRGAALATGIGYTVPAIIGAWYFARNRQGSLYFVKPVWNWSVLAKSATNGASEMVTMLAMSITAVVMNNILIRLVGYEGVAAAGIMFVGQGLLVGVLMGYSSGIAPIISFNFGAHNRDRLKQIFRLSLGIIAVASVLSIVAGWFLASPLTVVYVPRSTEIYRMAVAAFRIGLIGFLFTGFNMFASTLFTALNNGKVSALLSFFRTLVFILLMLSLLPGIMGLNGVWLALPAAELLALGTSIWFVAKRRSHYGYA